MAILNDRGEVRAAGGVIVRRHGERTEVLLVHRPRYGDWTFPKGKVEPGESDEQCALREVEEETGFRCTLGDELATTRWVDRFGRDKVCRYWAMSITAGGFVPSDEVDEIKWVALDDLPSALSYDRDVDVVRSLT